MFDVSVKQIVDNFSLEVLYGKELEKRKIKTASVNRPGLQLAGFMAYFEENRVQIMGKAEIAYLEQLDANERTMVLDSYFIDAYPCIVIARGLKVPLEMMKMAVKYDVPVLRTKGETSRFLSAIINYLNLELAPRITQHGVFVDVYGEGILILGESGVGKSETALELVKRGHRLIADDVVEIRRVSEKTLLGTAPEIIRHLIEIRGVGIIDVKNLYGVGAVKVIQDIALVMKLENWDENKEYERLGLEERYITILDIKLPVLEIPVKPGRNIAMIVEVAAKNLRQKEMGYNTAKNLNKKIKKGNSNAD